MSETLKLAIELIRRDSVTPEDKGCQTLIADRLATAGFNIEHMPIENVDNLWAVRGENKPLLVFAGHTDVVPAGRLDKWQSDPYKPEIREGILYGRGAADMKGSLAAMVVASERFVARYPAHEGSIAFLITSDEEGDAYHGTDAVMKILGERNIKIDWAMVGEPSSTNKVGDTVKVGRRGSLLGKLHIKGIQGHVAYPHLAKNPVHLVAPALAALSCETWDEGNDAFPPTSFQISNFNSGTGASNVIPGEADVMFSFRFSTEVTAEILQERVYEILSRFDFDFDLDFELKGLPFLTQPGNLTRAIEDAIFRVTGEKTELSTAGGTSDGRFIAPTGAQVIELGPVNATIHQVNECVSVDALDELAQMYENLLENLLVHQSVLD